MSRLQCSPWCHGQKIKSARCKAAATRARGVGKLEPVRAASFNQPANARECRTLTSAPVLVLSTLALACNCHMRVPEPTRQPGCKVSASAWVHRSDPFVPPRVTVAYRMGRVEVTSASSGTSCKRLQGRISHFSNLPRHAKAELYLGVLVHTANCSESPTDPP